MPSKQKLSGKYIEQLCRKFTKTPTLALAKKAFAERPELFMSIESARSSVRVYRGELNSKIGYVSNEKITKRTVPASNKPFEDPLLPSSHALKKEAWNMPKSSKKILILSDIHIPYQDNEALETAVNYGLSKGVDTIYLNGDILDVYDLSFHEKDKRKRPTTAQELEMGRQFLSWLRHKVGDRQIYYIPGNHEKRIERWLKVKAPEWLDCEEFRLEILLRFAEYKVHHIPHGTKVYFGKLLVEHGDKLKGSGGVNPARTCLLRFKRSMLVGHFHRTSQANSKIYDSDIYMAWSTGCLCELEPDYMEQNEHNHGAAIVTIMDNGKFRVENFQINGKEVF